MQMQFTTVKRAVKAVHVDGYDNDRAPEVEQVQGSVTFYPMMGEGDSVQVQTVEGPVTVVLTPITVRIADGMVMHRGGIGVQLFAGGKGSEPSLIRWRARFTNLQSDGVPIQLRDVVFDAVPGGEVDLTTAAPLANAPEPIVRGPQGVSMDSLTVEGGDLVVWGRSESGKQGLSRIKMSQITEPAAQAAADDTLAKLKKTLDAKADKDETAQALGTKANQEAVTTALALKADKTALTTGLSGKADTSHKHTSADVTDAKSTPTAGVLVKYDTGGLFTVGTPKVDAHPTTKKYVEEALTKKADKQHSHPISDVTGLQAALDVKAANAHKHGQGDIIGLDTTLAGKADKTHSHGWDGITGKPTTFTPAAHSHTIGNVTGLQSALDDKLPKTHFKVDSTLYDPQRVVIDGFTASDARTEVAGILKTAGLTSIGKTGVWSIAVGVDAVAEHALGVAVGAWSVALGEQVVALGSLAVASAQCAVSIGPSAIAMGTWSLALGGAAKVGKGATNSVALGPNAVVNTPNTIQLGASGATVNVSGDLTIPDPKQGRSAATKHYVDTRKVQISQVNGLAAELGARPNAWIIETAAELKATEAKARPGDIIFVDETGEKWKVS